MEKVDLEGKTLPELVGYPMEEISDYLDSRRSNCKGNLLIKKYFGDDYAGICSKVEKSERRKIIVFLSKIKNCFMSKDLIEYDDNCEIGWQNDLRKDLPDFVKTGMVKSPLSPELIPISESIPVEYQAATRLSIGLYDGWMYSPKLVAILLGITEDIVRMEREQGIAYLTQLIAAEYLKQPNEIFEEQAMTLSRLFKNNEEK